MLNFIDPNNFAFINIFIIIIILFTCYRNKLNLLLGLLYYLAFHYALGSLNLFIHLWENPLCLFNPSYVPFNNGLYRETVCLPSQFYSRISHTYENGFGETIGVYSFIFIIIICCVFLLNFKRNDLTLLYSRIDKSTFLKIYFLCFLIIVFLNTYTLLFDYFMNFQNKQSIKFLKIHKGNIFFTFSLLFTIIGYLSFTKNPGELNLTNKKIKILILVLFLTFCVGFVEVMYGLTNSFTALDGNITIFRANSTFLNPNVYAIWLGMIFLILSAIFWLNSSDIKKLLLPMFVLVFSIYITGSRSVFLILVIALSFITLLMPGRKQKFIPILIFFFSFLFIYLFSLTMKFLDFAVFDLSNNRLDIYTAEKNFGKAGFNSLVNLGDRFLLAPIQAFYYAINTFLYYFFETIKVLKDMLISNFEISLYDTTLPNKELDHTTVPFFSNSYKKIMSDETILSMDLRFNVKALKSQYGDNGYLGFIQKFGYFTLMLYVLQSAVILWQSVSIYLKDRNTIVSIIIGMQIFVILISSVIKFYDFPVIIMLSIINIFILVLITYKIDNKKC